MRKAACWTLLVPLFAAKCPGEGRRRVSQTTAVLAPLWAHPIAGKWTDVAAADLDGDGTEEVLAVETGGSLQVLDSQGRSLHRYRLPKAVALIQVGRLGPGSNLSVVGWGNWEEPVIAFDSQLREQWRFRNGDSGVDWVRVADLDGDGAAEVIVGYNGGAGLHVLSGAGKPRWRDMKRGNCWNVGSAAGSRCGQLVLSTDADGGIHIYSGTGKEQPGITSDPLGRYFRLLEAADLNGDGEPEIAAYGSDTRRDRSEWLCLFSTDRQLLWQRRVAPEMQSWRSRHLAFPALRPNQRIIAAGTDDGAVQLFDRAGNALGRWKAPHPLTSLCGARLGTGPEALVVATEKGLCAYRMTVAQ